MNAAATPAKIFLVDDHALVRAGINALLAQMPNVEVIGQAENGHDALREIARLHPDIVLLDISMAGLNGLEVARRIRQETPAARIIMLSIHNNEDYVAQAFRAGAVGYLLKGSAPSELEVAINAVMRGDVYLCPGVSKTVVSGFVKNQAKGADTEDKLTARQREILQLIAEGRTTKEIALQLDISVKTVETHRAQIMERLNIRDVPGLVRYAIRKGLVNVEH
jgi:DNA-binding NarL/FixJ family response regulator